MASGHRVPEIQIIVNQNDEASNTFGGKSLDRTATTNSSTSAASTSRLSSYLSDVHEEIDDELESMLSLSQTLSFWDEDGQDADEYTYATDDDGSLTSNSLESVSTAGDTRARRRRTREANKKKLAAQVAACGDGIETASDALLQSLVDTGNIISQVIKHGSRAKSRLGLDSLFMTKEEREAVRKEKAERLEEERRLKREKQLREDVRTSRDEVMNVANLWREK